MNQEIIERFNLFFKLTGFSKVTFSNLIGIKKQNLNFYLNGNYDISSHYLNLHNAGCNLNWLMSGELPMFSNTIEGIKLQRKHEGENSQVTNNEFILQKINVWIKLNYDSISNFANVNNVDLETITNYLDTKNIISNEFLSLLNISGCNVNWLYGHEDWYLNDTTKGNELKNKTNSNNSMKELMTLHFRHLESQKN